MTFDISIPGLEKGQRTAKDHVISTLAYAYPLTIAKITTIHIYLLIIKLPLNTNI